MCVFFIYINFCERNTNVCTVSGVKNKNSVMDTQR